MKDLKGDWSKDIHKFPSNESSQEIRLTSRPNATNEKLSKTDPKIAKKEKHSGCKIWQEIDV